LKNRKELEAIFKMASFIFYELGATNIVWVGLV
jgi:hypothetical protein